MENLGVSVGNDGSTSVRPQRSVNTPPAVQPRAGEMVQLIRMHVIDAGMRTIDATLGNMLGEGSNQIFMYGNGEGMALGFANLCCT